MKVKYEVIISHQVPEFIQKGKYKKEGTEIANLHDEHCQLGCCDFKEIKRFITRYIKPLHDVKIKINVFKISP